MVDPDSMLHQAATSATATHPGPTLTIRVPWNRIAGPQLTGSVRAPDGTPLPAFRLSAQRLDAGGVTSNTVTLEQEDGSFRSARLLPGRYVLAASDDDLGRLALGRIRLERGSDRDLGVHRFATPGGLEIAVVSPSDEALPQARVVVLSETPFGTRAHSTVPRNGARVELQPGSYRVATVGSALATALSDPIDVVSGRTERVVLSVGTGLECSLRFPPIDADEASYRCDWRDAHGRLVYRSVHDVTRSLDAPTWRVRIRPGEYTIELVGIDGRRATTTAVISEHGERPGIELPLPAHR